MDITTVSTPVTALVVGDVVTFDGSLPGLRVVKVGKGAKQRKVTYLRSDGEEFYMTHLAATSMVPVVVTEGCAAR